MIQKKESDKNGSTSSLWVIYALCSAVFAYLTSILGKIGIEGVESNLGIAKRKAHSQVFVWPDFNCGRNYVFIDIKQGGNTLGNTGG